MTSAQISAEHTLLRSIFPEMESVQIGTQTWTTSNSDMVITPQGNIIPEVQITNTWITANSLYNNTYESTEGDSNIKEYAALKEAAMWCSYNNDTANQAIFGKLYNWYAIKLLQTDITKYNIANPTTPWGWHIPTTAELTTLRTYLGDDNGEDLQYNSTSYWTNGTGTNSSGFTALPGGYRDIEGTFRGINTDCIIAASDNNTLPQLGTSIRFIKD